MQRCGPGGAMQKLAQAVQIGNGDRGDDEVAEPVRSLLARGGEESAGSWRRPPSVMGLTYGKRIKVGEGSDTMLEK